MLTCLTKKGRVIKMRVDRIIKNEERLDKALMCIKNLEKALDDFVSLKKDIYYLNNYYRK